MRLASIINKRLLTLTTQHTRLASISYKQKTVLLTLTTQHTRLGEDC